LTLELKLEVGQKMIRPLNSNSDFRNSLDYDAVPGP